MSGEFQYVGIQLIIKAFFLLALIFSGIHFTSTSKKFAKLCWLMAAGVFINILVSIPLPFQFNAIGFSYMSTHILAIMSMNFLRIMSIQFLPYDERYQLPLALKNPKVYLSIAGIFILLAGVIVVITGFGVFVDENKIFYLFVSMDAFVSTVVSVIWGVYFTLSFKSIIRIKSLYWMQGIVMASYNLFYILFFAKILMLLPLPDSVWYRMLSLVFYIVNAMFFLMYLMSIAQRQFTSITEEVAITDEQAKDVLSIEALRLVLQSKQFSLELALKYRDGHVEVAVLELQRPVKPFTYWLQFALATKNGLMLTHSDMSVIKFRMVEFWNKSMSQKISQELLYTDSRLEYALLIDAKHIGIDYTEEQLPDRGLFDATFKEFYSDFLPWVKEQEESSNETPRKWTSESALDFLLTRK